MQIKELIEIFEKNYPMSLNEEWDNSGVQIGNINNQIKNIMVTLEITEEAIDKAIEEDVNFIICHHPIIFPTIQNVVTTNFKGNKLIKAIQNDITIYASHSPSDKAGFNEYIFNKIGFQSQGKIDCHEEGIGFGDYCEHNIKLRPLLEQLKENLNLEHVIVWGDKTEFSKIGLVTGSGMSFLDQVIELGIDLFITGDITHHSAMDAIEQGLTLIDISHEGSEKLFTYFVEKVLDDVFEQDEIKIINYYNEEKYIRKIM